jgi:hypothetical protein
MRCRPLEIVVCLVRQVGRFRAYESRPSCRWRRGRRGLEGVQARVL